LTKLFPKEEVDDTDTLSEPKYKISRKGFENFTHCMEHRQGKDKKKDSKKVVLDTHAANVLPVKTQTQNNV
jgi:hypothetical protein